jgi:predicted metal-dependent enzyme (double-stranded beta helix superfamily)
MSLTAARRRRKKVRTLTTSGDHAAAMSHPKPADELRPLLAAVREVVAGHLDWHETASSVAAALSRHLPSPAVLSPAQRLGDPDGYRSHVLHAEPDGSFSVVALVWRPGQRTPIHDHVTWCVFGVIQGVEHEELFELDEGGECLYPASRSSNDTGDVCGFAPPGDIHRVRNAGDETAISIHVYGTDVSRIGSSVRRYYDLPVRAADRTA